MTYLKKYISSGMAVLAQALACLILASFGRLGSLHFMAAGLESGDAAIRGAILFCSILALHEWSRMLFAKKSIGIMFGFFAFLRSAVTEMAFRSGALSFERAQKKGLFAMAFQEISLIEQNCHRIFTFVLSAALALAYMAYLFFLDARIGSLIVPILAVLILSFFLIGEKTTELQSKVRGLHQQKSVRRYRLLAGKKELSANSHKQQTAYTRFDQAANDYFEADRPNNLLFFLSRNWPEMFMKAVGVCFFLIVSFLVDAQSYQAIYFKLLATLLFLLQTLVSLLGQAHGVYSIYISYQSIEAALTKIDALSDRAVMPAGGTGAMAFTKSIALRNVSMTYMADSNKAFAAGPFTLDIRKGEVVFVVGGNGSGKTTFLKLLTALFERGVEGKILVDGVEVCLENQQSYQELFFILTADFYAFTEPFGIENVPKTRVDRLIRLLDLEKAVGYSESGFSSNRLSTGQKKRLGLLWGFLEDKDIYVFDEAGADQDPENRRRFYEFILPDMKKAGKTVIAVTHDERYLRHADRILEMADGRLTERPVV